MRFDDRVVEGARATRCTSLTHHGPYTQAEVWANKMRFRISFDRYLNIISIQRFVQNGLYDYWQWRQEFNRGYKRKSSLKPLHVDIIVCALESARRWKLARSVKP